MSPIRIFVASLAVAGVLAGMGAGAATAAAVSRFDDGSFETPTVGANTFVNLGTGASIGPWKVTAGNVDLIGDGFWQAAEGNQSVDLNGGGAGTVAQTFATVPGKKYSVTYSLAGNPGGGPAVRTGKVLVDGQTFQDFSFDVTGKTWTNMGYVTREVTFVARGTSTTLAFASTNSSAYGPVIDDVRVSSCTPCPSCD
ncbi:choice-of-anchor C family protein [Streptomyces malaysiensis subsp. malaysiensis]|uniref:choice-of-anchor C family protein n=1 Tax=Streptomyces malaysiensis TaxID=92644 RepID=UPI0024BFA999|nr:choice-of-anchor C family protein [Streptomyces sp. NA07423]WHX20704.1 choice-of-anchor C family protein [Streptomyces sp. NA07423]